MSTEEEGRHSQLGQEVLEFLAAHPRAVAVVHDMMKNALSTGCTCRACAQRRVREALRSLVP